MVDFIARDGVRIAEGHGLAEADLRAGVAAALTVDRSVDQAQAHASTARLAETWYSDTAGFGHDCSAHPSDQAGPHCGTFRAVTIAEGIPAPATVERVQRAAGVKGKVARR